MITLSITTAGIPWSAAELARITPDPEAPLCSVQQQLEALGYRVTAIQGSGCEVSAEVEVTGESITDEQIRALRRASGDNFADIFRDALRLHGADPGQKRYAARARCAAIINARAPRSLAMRVWYPPGTPVLVDVGAVFGDLRTPRLGTVTRCQVLPSSVYEIDLGDGDAVGGIPPAHVSLAPASPTGATP